MDESASVGRVVLAATPLGNPADGSSRLAATLANADIIAAEDTRKLRGLASALEVSLSAAVVSFYEEVERRRLPKLLESLREGRTVLVVTDAGMPSVSDPGYRLVAACVAEGVPITCLPGPSAVTTALAVSGLPCDRFCFEGFAPRKGGDKSKWLAALIREQRTTVFFESPHRLASTLAEAERAFGATRQAVVCRELTKTYEEVRRGTLAELARWAEEGVRGEITVVLAGAPAPEVNIADLVAEVAERVDSGERLKSVAAEVARAAGASKNELYSAVLAARSSGG